MCVCVHVHECMCVCVYVCAGVCSYTVDNFKEWSLSPPMPGMANLSADDAGN